MDWKAKNDFLKKWTNGLKVTRAWRIRNRVAMRTIAPDAFQRGNRFERSTKAMLLTELERQRAFSHPVDQVNVFGETVISKEELGAGVLGEVLKPSTGIVPSIGARTTDYQDGESALYLMELNGGAHALLGLKDPNRTLVKVGRSNDPKRRRKQINEGFPQSSKIRWEIKIQQMFSDVESAHRLESELKEKFAEEFQSEGNEFFSGDRAEILRAFEQFCTSNLPIILGAPGKARDLK